MPSLATCTPTPTPSVTASVTTNTPERKPATPAVTPDAAPTTEVSKTRAPATRPAATPSTTTRLALPAAIFHAPPSASTTAAGGARECRRLAATEDHSSATHRSRKRTRLDAASESVRRSVGPSPSGGPDARARCHVSNSALARTTSASSLARRSSAASTSASVPSAGPASDPPSVDSETARQIAISHRFTPSGSSSAEPRSRSRWPSSPDAEVLAPPDSSPGRMLRPARGRGASRSEVEATHRRNNQLSVGSRLAAGVTRRAKIKVAPSQL